MEKKLLFALFFCSLHFFSSSLFANNNPFSAVDPALNSGGCAAPPPDSFRITGYGFGYVSLAWSPITAGADHQITVYQGNGSGGWDSLYAVFLPNSTSYTATNLNTQKQHVFKIRTVCSNGDPSTFASPFTGPQGFILDLTTTGVAPTNSSVTNCKGIQLPKEPNDWVGFRVQEWENGGVINSTIFEFEAVDDPQDLDLSGRVKRVVPLEGNVLVAASIDRKWPVGINDVQSGLAFLVGKINEAGNLYTFGSLEVSFDLEKKPPTLGICKADKVPWDSKFSYEPWVGKRGNSQEKGRADFGEHSNQLNTNELIKIQNPSTKYLNIFFNQKDFLSGDWEFKLENINGKIILQETINVPEPRIYIPYSSISFGLYVLVVKSPNGQIQKTKVIISE